MNFSTSFSLGGIFNDLRELDEEMEELSRLCADERRTITIDLAENYISDDRDDYFANNISYTAVKKRRAARKKKIARKSELPIFGIKIQESL